VAYRTGTVPGARSRSQPFMRRARGAPATGNHPPATGQGGVGVGQLFGECLANIECRVVDVVERHNIVVLDGIAAYVDSKREERRTLHAVGDGTFVADGEKFDRRKAMRSKLPPGV